MIKKMVKTEPVVIKPDEMFSRGFICRLDFENTKRMKKYLAKKGYSFSSFVKDVLEREVFRDEEMETISISKSNEVNPATEDCSTGLEKIHQIALHQNFDFRLCPIYCPNCDDQQMSEYIGQEIRSKVAKSWVIVWDCPKCGYSFDTKWSVE